MSAYSLRISTTQFAISDEPIIEEAKDAVFRVVNGTRYISYVVPPTENAPAVSTVIQINEKSIEIRRSGGIQGKLVYSLDESPSSQMDFGFAVMNIKNKTDHLAIYEIDGNLAVNIKYKLFINDNFISECETDFLLTSVN